jgi:hypothetical protein
MWIGLADLLLCILSVVIVAVAPTKAKVDGVKPKAEFLITADWKVELDSDVDLWIVGPEKKPIFYGSREVGCASLDRDSLGYSTSQITLADGSLAQSESNKETATIRCVAPGRYDVGVNLYSDRELAKGAQSIPVRVEITGLNPQVTTLSAKDVVLDQVGQTINVVSFDLSSDGQITLVEPPLEPITDAYKRDKPWGGASEPWPAAPVRPVASQHAPAVGDVAEL